MKRFLVKFNNHHYFINPFESVGPNDGWAIEIKPNPSGELIPTALITPEQNKNCKSINTADFWNKIIATTDKLDNIPQLTLSQLQDLLKTDQEIRDDKLNKLLE